MPHSRHSKHCILEEEGSQDEDSLSCSLPLPLYTAPSGRQGLARASACDEGPTVASYKPLRTRSLREAGRTRNIVIRHVLGLCLVRGSGVHSELREQVGEFGECRIRIEVCLGVNRPRRLVAAHIALITRKTNRKSSPISERLPSSEASLIAGSASPQM